LRAQHEPILYDWAGEIQWASQVGVVVVVEAVAEVMRVTSNASLGFEVEQIEVVLLVVICVTRVAHCGVNTYLCVCVREIS
jgi:hypothetical protein